MSGGKLEIQKQIDATEEYGHISIEFNEYVEQIVIDKPITITGNDSTICSASGPVISINSSNVKISRLRVEITSDEIQNDESGLALRISENVKVELENVVVKGNVSGIVFEDGSWNYPDVLNLWPVVPETDNYFSFDMEVPVSCLLETNISDLKILNPGTQPGVNRVNLELSRLKKEVIIFGQIEFRTPSSIRRIISVSGGTFGMPDNLPAPDKNRPIHLVSRTKPHLSDKEKKQKSIKKKEKSKQEDKKSPLSISPVAWIVMAVVLISLALVFANEIFFSKKPEPPPRETEYKPQTQKDTQKPTALIHDFRKQYTAGDRVKFKIDVKDDKQLESVRFNVKNTSIQKTWTTGKKTFSESYSFSTKKWAPGDYSYHLEVFDESGNFRRYSNDFKLVPVPDKQYPTVEVSTIEKQYKIGQKIPIQVEASDDKKISQINFQVKNTRISKKWYPDKARAVYTSSFETDDLKPGSFDYVVSAIDSADKKTTRKGSFVLQLAGDNQPPTGSASLKQSYNLGDTVVFNVSAKDNRSLRRVIFQVVNTNIEKIWEPSESAVNYSSRF
jgi:ribosomal protein L21E